MRRYSELLAWVGAAAASSGPALRWRARQGVVHAFTIAWLLVGSEKMTQLKIDLQEGFHEDTVILRAGGQEITKAAGVTTRVQTGLARSLEIEVPESAESIEIEVPTRGEKATVDLDRSKPMFVGVSLSQEGRLKSRVSATPFGYL